MPKLKNEWMRILVIEDRDDAFEMISDIISKKHQVFGVRTIHQADMSTGYDLVICDYFNCTCPYSLVQKVCRDHGIPLIITTASPEQVHEYQINKPYDACDFQRAFQLIRDGAQGFVVDTIITRYLPSSEPKRAA